MRLTLANYITLLLCSIFSLTCYAETAIAQADTVEDATYEIILKVSNFKNHKGKLYAQLYDQEGNVLKNVIQKLSDSNIVIHAFKGISTGNYAIRVFHDENDNGKLDTNLFGVPKERFGYSNNVMGRFGPPKFKDQLFYVDGSTELMIQMIER